jgi:hypothetical protein
MATTIQDLDPPGVSLVRRAQPIDRNTREEYMLREYDALRELLLAYMKHVIEAEGVDFIDRGGYAGDVALTTEMRDRLNQFSEECDRRAPEEWPSGIIPKGRAYRSI